MGNFARALHHLDMKDVKKKRLEEIAAQKLKEKKDKEQKKIIQEISKKYKSDWKREIYEGMTTANATTITVAPAEGDGTVTAVDVIDASSYSGTVDGFLESGDSFDGNTGSVIRDNGSGSGQDGGFNVGGKYLSFQGDGYNEFGSFMRWAVLTPIDSSRINSLTITAIVGNDSNGGEDPDASLEDLRLMYKTPSMDQFRLIVFNPSGSVVGATNSDIIIPLGASGNSGLNNYSIEIPEWTREKNTQFALIQLVSSGTGFDNYGITNIKFQRTTPVNVVVPLDDPEAISFVRVGSDEGDPKKRKKKLNDQLAASDEYTQAQLGDDFPGGGARVGGDDPFASAKIGDDVEPSPIGKDEVKKSFSTFSTDTAVATAADDADKGTTQVIVTPSTQTTMNPTNDEGEEITVKTVGGKNSGAIQGADAANVDAQEPEPTEPEPTESEPEVDPEEIKPDPEELKGKTPEEVKEIEKEKFNSKADESADYIDKLVNFDLNAGLSSFNAFAQVAGTVVNTAINIISFGANLLGFKTSQEGGYLGGLGKLKNSIKIAQGVLSGKIVNANPLPQEIKTFTDSIKLDEFTSDKIFISSVRHEYADDNIYVKDGKVYSNRDGDREGVYATPLANKGFAALGVHGNGYAQMIIPEDGSEPYLHYYDHNYENLLSIEDVSVSGGVIETLKTDPQYRQDGIGPLMKSISNIIHQLKGNNMKFVPQKLRESLVSYFGAFDQVMDGLKKTSSMEGWPPGIHGSALTDFKVPLSKLPKETQEMIANHPLSWTPERIANMKEEDWIGEMQKRMEGKDYEDFDETMLAAMKDPDTGSTVDPEYLEKYQRFSFAQYDEKTKSHPDAKEGTVEYDYDRAVEELKKATENPDYDKATQAAYQEYQDILAEQEEKYAANEEKFGLAAQSNLWEKLVGPSYRAVSKVLNSGGSIEYNNPTYQKMVNGYKEYEKQVKVLERKYAQGRDEIGDEYDKLSDEAYAKYEDTFTVIKLDDGTMGLLNGGDFKTKNGKIIPGKRTLTAKEQARFQEIRAEYDEVQEYLYSNTDYMDNMYIPYVLYDVKTGFGKYDISGDSWSPEKKGSGERSEDEPKQPKPRPRSGSGSIAGLDDPIIGLDADDDDLLASAGYSIEDKKNVINLQKKLQNNPNYQPKPFEMDSLLRQRRAQQNQGSMVAHYQPKGNHLLEKYANPNGDNYSLFERLKQKQFFNPKDIKPTFPENPPPQLDPKTGMHPNYGKNAKRFKKLDPISANAMPPTGDSETDAVVDKQRTKPKTKLYDRLKKNIRKDLTNK